MSTLLAMGAQLVAKIAIHAKIASMAETLIDRVRQVISTSGLSQSQFAEKIGIDSPKLTKSLNGRRRFSTYELAAVAEVGNQSVDWLLKGQDGSRVLAHRALENAAADGDVIGRVKIGLVEERVAGLTFLGRPFDVTPLPAAVRSGSKVAQGEATAAAYVRLLGSPLRELSTAALIDTIEQKFGTNVIIADLPDGCDGLAFAKDDVRVIVLATTQTAAYRQRFTLAHELGHIAFEDAKNEPIAEQLWVHKGHI